MTALALVRHGQSEWNLQNRFTGWVDVDLTAQGEAEARQSGRLLKETGIAFEAAYTSVLKRAIRTLWLALEEMDAVWLPTEKDFRLNERHYGALTGLNKAETAEKHGADQVHVWRRSYDTPPPPLALDDPRHPRHEAKYARLDPALLPGTESLKITLERVLPYWESAVAPQLAQGRHLVVAAHGNSLRAIIKHLFQVSDADIPGVEVPTGNPLLITLEGASLGVVEARYLDTDRAQPLPATP